MKKFHLLLALLAGFLLNTATAQIDQQYDFDEPFEIGNEERVSFGKDNFSIMVAELIEDSRCPIDMTCIWEGQVKLKLLIQENGKMTSKEITLRGGRKAIVEIDGYAIELLEVKKIDMMGLKQYVYTLEVSVLD